MHINKINIQNYKCFYGKFTLELNPNVNILVGNNEAGKSTILEAINLALTGIIYGKYLRNELTPYLFNKYAVKDFVQSLSQPNKLPPPVICIELFFEGDELAAFKGDGNSSKENSCGLSFKIEFDADYQSEYEALVSSGDLKTVPVEYYHISWQSFARASVTSRSIPLKAAFIDSSSTKYQNGSDVYISRIIQADLEDSEKAAISQEYRKMKEQFGNAEPVKEINQRLKTKSKISDKDLSISVDMDTYNSWQTTLMTFLDDIPFHQIGKGEQCIIKTNLALGHKRGQNANVILLEEPENHLSHTRLNQLLTNIESICTDRQIIISTHNNFVANKLGLDKLIFLNNRQSSTFSALPNDTYRFFKKLPGYQTLRLLLCKKAVLVEGPSDELIFQKSYLEQTSKLPIEDGIELISVGLSFKRFLDLAKPIKKPTAVITDNDGNFKQNISMKYEAYEDADCIAIFADDRNSLYTLEPQFLDANKENISLLYGALHLDKDKYASHDKILNYMLENKTEWALNIFETDLKLNFPKYINMAVEWCSREQ